MPVVASFDWPNRRIYMAEATWHPLDVYREMRADRRLNEYGRQFDPLVKYDGNVPKGGGKFTPRYMTMLQGAKIVPVDGGTEPITDVQGEIITDDQTPFIDVSSLTTKPQVNYAPAEAEIIEVMTGSGINAQDIVDIAEAVRARLLSTESFPP